MNIVGGWVGGWVSHTPSCLAISVPSFEQGAYGKRDRFYEKGYDYDAADNSTGEVQLCFFPKSSIFPFFLFCLGYGLSRVFSSFFLGLFSLPM